MHHSISANDSVTAPFVSYAAAAVNGDGPTIDNVPAVASLRVEPPVGRSAQLHLQGALPHLDKVEP